MKVLVAHNRYRSGVPSGENTVVEQELNMLRDAGVEVVPFIRDSDSVAALGMRQRAMLPIAPVYFPPGLRSFRAALLATRPDVVHLHNPYPLISPWVVRVARAADIPVVHSVHNFRVACMKGTLYRAGHACEDCVGRATKWPGVVHGCYRGSRAQSFSMAVGLTVHRSTWTMVDRHLVLTDWMRRRLIAEGIPAHSIDVKRNAAAGPESPPPLGGAVIFIGRLDEEKGVDLLLDAWNQSTLRRVSRLIVVGDGPMRRLVEGAAAADPTIDFRGLLPSDGVAAALAEAGLVVLPSRVYEGLPRVIAEAFAFGRGVATTAAALSDVIADAGVLVAPVADGLSRALELAHERRETLSAHARRIWEEQMRPSVVVDQLISAYRAVGA